MIHCLFIVKHSAIYCVQLIDILELTLQGESMKNLFFACVLMMSSSVFACGGSDKSADASESTSESTVMTSESSESDTVASVDSAE